MKDTDDLAITSRMRAERELLAEFGAQLHGSDPGVPAYLKDDTGRITGQGNGYFGESLTFTRKEWTWLRPLLEELRTYRKSEKVRDVKASS